MSRAADVYSFAMIMWELFACKRLYEGHIASQVCKLTCSFLFKDRCHCAASHWAGKWCNLR